MQEADERHHVSTALCLLSALLSLCPLLCSCCCCASDHFIWRQVVFGWMPQHVEQLPVRVRQGREANRGSAGRQTAGRCSRRIRRACCMGCRGGCSGVDVARTRQTRRRRALRRGSGGFAVRRRRCRRSSKGEHRVLPVHHAPASFSAAAAAEQRPSCCFNQTLQRGAGNGPAQQPLTAQRREGRGQGVSGERALSPPSDARGHSGLAPFSGWHAAARPLRFSSGRTDGDALPSWPHSSVRSVRRAVGPQPDLRMVGGTVAACIALGARPDSERER